MPRPRADPEGRFEEPAAQHQEPEAQLEEPKAHVEAIGTNGVKNGI